MTTQFFQWSWVIYLFGAMLAVTLVMMWLSTRFITLDPIRRRFSIMEMELPATRLELHNIIKGIYALPEDERRSTLTSLRAQLWVDFIFMPLAYGTIALLCIRVGHKLPEGFLREFFFWVARLQVLPWLFDIIENIYLFVKLREKRRVPETPLVEHRLYHAMEVVKWSLALLGATLALWAVAYFFISGDYHNNSLLYVGYAAGELVLFLWLKQKLVKPATLTK